MGRIDFSELPAQFRPLVNLRSIVEAGVQPNGTVVSDDDKHDLLKRIDRALEMTVKENATAVDREVAVIAVALAWAGFFGEMVPPDIPLIPKKSAPRTRRQLRE